MKKDKFNSIFLDYVRHEVSPSKEDRSFVSVVYDSFRKLLNQNCIQIGSYPRFTAITPLHDLDILYILGEWNEQQHDPKEALEELFTKIKSEYENPTMYSARISKQTHSISVSFVDGINNEVFSVDIVPSYIFSKNEFDGDTYKVPEIVQHKHGRRRKELYEKISNQHLNMNWIDSDPRGYIEIAKNINQENSDFRKVVKFVKSWKNIYESEYDDFKFKSFHIEQVITRYFQDDLSLDIYDGIFRFFCDIPNIIQSPQIVDRADDSKYIDSYVSDFTDRQKKMIVEARDYFLITLERFKDASDMEDLLSPCFHERASKSESYLFDSSIPTFINSEYEFRISGFLQNKEGFREYKYRLDTKGTVEKKKWIKFSILDRGTLPGHASFKWKVKNCDKSPEPRGEISSYNGSPKEEKTLYVGEHYVECFAILDNACVAKSRQNVTVLD